MKEHFGQVRIIKEVSLVAVNYSALWYLSFYDILLTILLRSGKYILIG
jgi:hypothetical protein